MHLKNIVKTKQPLQKEHHRIGHNFKKSYSAMYTQKHSKNTENKVVNGVEVWK